MSLAIVYSRAAAGMLAPAVNVEVHLSRGLPGFNIVGLPEKAVKESKDRIRSAILNCGFKFPAKRIVVNLAPADLRKEGGRFDLPMAIGILLASEQIPEQPTENFEITGELELSGKLRAVNGILPFALATQKSERTLILPKTNLEEAALLSKLPLLSAEHLIEIVDHMKGVRKLTPIFGETRKVFSQKTMDLSEVKGQSFARRALEIAAAGSHSLLLSGPPGSGKTLLASCLPSILPPMREQDALEVAALYSMSRQGFDHQSWGLRPFRAPHHTASSRALVGGGSPPQPGEISLAHQGVLFLDEFPEFSRQSLEALREPLEAGKIVISRAAYQTEYPAKFQLIAAMNPCPCGYASQKDNRCRCTSDQIRKYQLKISGPMLDRIDMHVMVSPLPNHLLLDTNQVEENSAVVAQRVLHAREYQETRLRKPNAWLSSSEVVSHCHWTAADRQFFTEAINRLQMSARAYHRTLKLARTIADLASSPSIKRSHLEEALCYRVSGQPGTGG
ncbi:MAG: YifB family Mg chelatase-like AAA ATPase [Coxiellaceae bacterium]|nr:YifB family Mg chelatase-like AAA ATPase [Coxiellaceae bacterium]